MNRKRNNVPALYKHKKRICMAPISDEVGDDFPDDKGLGDAGTLMTLRGSL